MVEVQVQEIVTLDSTDVQEGMQVESEPAPKKWLALEIPAATIPSVLQMKAPQNGEGSRHLRILRVFEADCFLHHLFTWPFLRG